MNGLVQADAICKAQLDNEIDPMVVDAIKAIRRQIAIALHASADSTGEPGAMGSQDAKMELSLILTQWSMPDDLRTALNHLKLTLDRTVPPNPSIPFAPEPLEAIRKATADCEADIISNIGAVAIDRTKWEALVNAINESKDSDQRNHHP